MTLIANWVAMDDNKGGKQPASLYLASDSRITYLDAKGKPLFHEDNMQKIFISTSYPEMFAICGDYNNCVKIIEKLISLIDKGDIALNVSSIEEKVVVLKEYFIKQINILKCKTIVLYGTKVGLELFLVRFILADKNVECNQLLLGKTSQVVSQDGSGEECFYEEWLRFNENAKAFNEADTSRGAFRCIYEAINKIEDPYVGGKMQAAVLYRGHKAPHPIGIYYDTDCYLFGKKHVAKAGNNVEYRNSEFEIVNPETGKIADGAQRQPFAER